MVDHITFEDAYREAYGDGRHPNGEAKNVEQVTAEAIASMMPDYIRELEDPFAQPITDYEGHIIETATQLGFQSINDDADIYVCTLTGLLDFASVMVGKPYGFVHKTSRALGIPVDQLEAGKNIPTSGYMQALLPTVPDTCFRDYDKPMVGQDAFSVKIVTEADVLRMGDAVTIDQATGKLRKADVLRMGDAVTIDQTTGKLRKAVTGDSNVFAMPPFEQNDDHVRIKYVDWDYGKITPPLTPIQAAD